VLGFSIVQRCFLKVYNRSEMLCMGSESLSDVRDKNSGALIFSLYK
jgi:hypothetical protein